MVRLIFHKDYGEQNWPTRKQKVNTGKLLRDREP